MASSSLASLSDRFILKVRHPIEEIDQKKFHPFRCFKWIA
jgi:hypothetical protein